MVQLEISSEDTKTLQETLEGVLSDLRYEINNTDSQDYREMLRTKKELLERVIGQLGAD